MSVVLVPIRTLFVKVTYTTGLDKGFELFLPVWPSATEEWRSSVTV